MVERPKKGTIPTSPGSYFFRDVGGRVIYVGKAKNLRNRLNSYFGSEERLRPRTAQMLTEAESVEWIQVANELEALLLEFSLIKEHSPRFNVDMKDSKSYPFLAVTVKDEWPRPMVTRSYGRSGVKYFGPFPHVGAVRETLDLLLKTFPLRTCSDNKFREYQRLGRPCLLFHIEKCSGPCVEKITSTKYEKLLNEFLSFLSGNTEEVVERLSLDMKDASERQEFELAARVRDRLSSVTKAIERQQMVLGSKTSIDVFGVWDDELEASIQVFYVRKGRVVGRKGFILDRVEDMNRSEMMRQVLSAHYRTDQPRGLPRVILLSETPTEVKLLTEWLSKERGSAVEIRTPQRGDKRMLIETVTANAREEFMRHRLKRASDHNARARALNELQTVLNLPVAPLRIECYDMSHLQGSDYVGSMVVMEDGLEKKSDYRRFRIKDVQGNNDYAAMSEVLTRRLTAYLKDRKLEVSERSGRFSYPPQLLLVDGGKGQLGVALKVVSDLGLEKEIPVAALAKQFEEIFRPGMSDPIRLERSSEALYLLQRIRDESHRFALEYHTKLRSKRMTASVLDGIQGLGPVRKKRLLNEFGSVSGIRSANLEKLNSLPWLPDSVGTSVYRKVHDLD